MMESAGGLFAFFGALAGAIPPAAPAESATTTGSAAILSARIATAVAQLKAMGIAVTVERSATTDPASRDGVTLTLPNGVPGDAAALLADLGLASVTPDLDHLPSSTPTGDRAASLALLGGEVGLQLRTALHHVGPVGPAETVPVADGAGVLGAAVAASNGSSGASAPVESPTISFAGPVTAGMAAQDGSASDGGSAEHGGDHAGRGLGVDAALASAPAEPAPVVSTVPLTGGPAVGVGPAALPGTPVARAAMMGADPTAGIARVQTVQELLALRPTGPLVIRLTGADGQTDRIRIDLHGQTLEARFDIANGTLADRLAARLPQLHDALARHGVDADRVQIATAGRVLDGNVAPSSSAPAREQHGHPDRETSRQHRHDQPREREERRSPSRDSSHPSP